MTVNVTYREAGAVVPGATTIKNSPLSNGEIDGNFKSVKDAVEVLSTSAGAGLIGVAPVGGVAATTVQSAISELDLEKAGLTTLAAPSGSSLVGYGTGSVKTALDTLTSPTGAASVGYTPAGTGAVATTVQSKLRNAVIDVRDFGAIGDGVTDDAVAFSNACAYAKSSKKPLDIRGMKLYLGTQASSINSENLYLIGDGTPSVPVNWDYMTGLNNQFSVIVSSIVSQSGSAIISRYNGAIFTGKTFSGENFIVVGDPSKASSMAFDTGTPTAYPGWSKPFLKLSNFVAYYFGSDGLRCRGGLEVTELNRVSANYCNGYCLNVHQTIGIDSPIEYLNIHEGEYTYGLLGNIYLNGARKQIKIHSNILNDPGQLSRRASGGFVITQESQIVYPIRIDKDPGSTIMLNMRVEENAAEYTQSIVAFYGLMNDCEVTGNLMFPFNISWPYYHAKFDTQIYNLRTSGNTSPSGVRFYFTPAQHNNSEAIYFAEKYDSSKGFVQEGAFLTETQMRPGLARALISSSIGNGSSGTFTYDLASELQWQSATLDSGARFAAFLVTANFQGTANNNIGAYLVFVTKMSSNNFAAIVQSTGTITGFSSAPTVSTAGVLSIQLSQFYRARVTRLDYAALS